MKQFSKFEMASIRRTNSSVKGYVKKLNIIKEKIAKLEAEALELQNEVDAWEYPVKNMSGGYTSTEILEMLESPIAEIVENVAEKETTEEFSVEDSDNSFLHETNNELSY